MIASNASKELEALAAHMPDIPDADARKLALRMYYLELSEGALLKDACPNESREEVLLLPQCVAGNIASNALGVTFGWDVSPCKSRSSISKSCLTEEA